MIKKMIMNITIMVSVYELLMAMRMMTNKKGNNKDEDANGDDDDSNLMMAMMTFCNLVR